MVLGFEPRSIGSKPSILTTIRYDQRNKMCMLVIIRDMLRSWSNLWAKCWWVVVFDGWKSTFCHFHLKKHENLMFWGWFIDKNTFWTSFSNENITKVDFQNIKYDMIQQNHILTSNDILTFNKPNLAHLAERRTVIWKFVTMTNLLSLGAEFDSRGSVTYLLIIISHLGGLAQW